MVLAFSLFMLFFEVLKSTRTGGNSVVDHALSMMVFVACLILFLIWPPASTSLFFMITLTACRRDCRFLGDDPRGAPRLFGRR